MCTYSWLMLRFDRKQQNSVEQLSFNKKINSKNIYILTRVWVCVCVCVCVCVLSCIWLCDPWTVARRAPLSMKFSRQEYWRVSISYSMGFSQPRHQTHISCVSCIGRRILYAEPLGKKYFNSCNDIMDNSKF